MSPMTDAEQERIFRDKELEFFGAVTASISHDMNNAIIFKENIIRFNIPMNNTLLMRIT